LFFTPTFDKEPKKLSSIKLESFCNQQLNND